MCSMLLKSRRIHSFRHLINKLSQNELRINAFYSTSEAVPEAKQLNEPIIIPKRIERGPTDILRALANTVGKDYSGPAYKYIDDPYLTPVSNLSKRSYSLSKESGRKAAQYFFDKYPDLFFRDNAEPKVEAFSYKDVYDENTDTDETDLQNCIIRSEVNNAIVCYNNIIRDGKDMSKETVHELLELVCFYNCEEPPDVDHLDEKWFKQQVSDSRKTWKDNGFAEQVFNSIEDKTSQTYCALIQGMAKHYQTDRAYFFFEQMLENNLEPNVETFNSLFKIVIHLKESSESRWLLIEDFLNRMKKYNVRPNLRTLNAILDQISRFGSWKFAKNLAQKTLVEMTSKLKIKPSLATYYHLLNIFCRERGPISPILYEIMDEIEGKEFVAQDPKDVSFFVKAMNICQNHLNDIQLAYRVHQCLSTGNNYRLLGDALNETVYYQMFFRLLCNSENVDIFMTIYNKYVPHVYIPEQFVMEEILQMINLYDAFHYVPQIWSDLVLFELTNKIKLIELILHIMSKTKVEDTLQNQFVEIAWDAIKRVDLKIENSSRYSMQNVEWTGNALGYCLTIFLNGNHMEKAYQLIKKLDSEQNKIVDYPQSKCLINFCLKAIEDKQYANALHCIRYSNEIGRIEVSKSVIKHIETIHLEENIKSVFENTCSKTALNEEDQQ